jgi:acyl carrier protein
MGQTVSLGTLKEILIKNLKLEDVSPEDIGDETALFGEEGLGLDSVDAIELVLTVDKEFGVKIVDSKMYETIFANVKSLHDYINAAQ